MPKRTVQIVNKNGLHARPAAEIVKLAAKFQSEITVIKDDLGAESEEERADGIDGVAGLTETDAEGNAALVAGLGRLEEGVRVPIIRFGRAASRILPRPRVKRSLATSSLSASTLEPPTLFPSAWRKV